jgi:hypothetical protein
MFAASVAECSSALVFYRAERNAMASTISQPVMTSAATAPGSDFGLLFRGVGMHSMPQLAGTGRPVREI